MFLSTVLMALGAIRRNALRSCLTMLGIVIGVSTVIALVNIGQGATAKVSTEIGKLGNHLLIISPGAGRHSATSTAAPGFTIQDVAALGQEIASIAQVAPTVGTQKLVVWGNRNHQTVITGSTNAYLETSGYRLSAGRAFTTSELSSGAGVCIIGTTTKTTLFGTLDPLGESLRVAKLSCQVIGVLAAKGQAAMGQDQDDIVVMPLRTVQRRLLGSSEIGTIFVSAKSAGLTGAAARQITTLLRQRRRIPSHEADNFSVRDMKEIADTMRSATGTLTALLGAIAAVSLLVGGIGIMNIMLVSVTERTREIGIRLSIGALARDVLFQFLVEAVVLSALGGVLGIGVGLLLSWLGTSAMGVPFLVQPNVLLLAFGFSAAVGVLFGYLPARQAARLNPIDALRRE